MNSKEFFIDFSVESIRIYKLNKQQGNEQAELIMTGITIPHYPEIHLEESYRQPAVIEISTQKEEFDKKFNDAVATKEENIGSIGYVTFKKNFKSYVKEADGYSLHFGTRFHLHFKEDKINDIVRNYFLMKNDYLLTFTFCLVGNWIRTPENVSLFHKYSLDDIYLSQDGALLVKETEYNFIIKDIYDD